MSPRLSRIRAERRLGLDKYGYTRNHCWNYYSLGRYLCGADRVAQDPLIFPKVWLRSRLRLQRKSKKRNVINGLEGERDNLDGWRARDVSIDAVIFFGEYSG